MIFSSVLAASSVTPSVFADIRDAVDQGVGRALHRRFGHLGERQKKTFI
jgi:hypothetical protein